MPDPPCHEDSLTGNLKIVTLLLGFTNHMMMIIIIITIIIVQSISLSELKEYSTGLRHVTRSAKISYVSTQKSPHFLPLLYHNSRFSYGNRMKFIPLMQKFIENLLKLAKCKYLF